MDEQKINRHWKDIINTMNDGLMVVSPDGTILMVNEALEKIMGYSREELIGTSCAKLHCDVCASARSEGKKHWCDLFEQGVATRKPCMFMRKDGSYVHLLKNAAILQDEAGNVLGAVETLTDISEITQRDEKIQQLSRLVDTSGDFHGMVGQSACMQGRAERSPGDHLRRKRHRQRTGGPRHPCPGHESQRALHHLQLRRSQ